MNLINVTASRTIAEQDAELGPGSSGATLTCAASCGRWSLSSALAGYAAWITGLRRDETVERRQARAVEWHARREMVKVNPIAAWSHKQVDDYIAENGTLVNPLVYDGYPSIGCAPCTRRITPGEDPRSERWPARERSSAGQMTT